ncbi:MAG: transketolase [Clostridia bacterium]
MYNEKKLAELKEFAKNIRIQSLEQFASRGFGHLGGSMSIVEMLTVLYGDQLRHDPKNPQWEERDRLVCSKGHAGPAVYAALALRGYMPLSEMKTLNINGTNLPSHCDMTKTPGIDVTTGSLGQGLSVASGLAYALKQIQGKDCKVFCIVGDGELQEGQNWEAMMNAAHKKIDNLILLMDSNKMQLDGPVQGVEDLGDINAKFEAFGWNVITVADGHDLNQLGEAVAAAKAYEGKPTAIVCHTLKGKGIVWAETEWNHHIEVSREAADAAIAALNA